MSREIRVILKGNAKDEFNRLNETVGKQMTDGKSNSDEIKLWKSIKKKVDLLKSNPAYGDNIPKKRSQRTGK